MIDQQLLLPLETSLCLGQIGFRPPYIGGSLLHLERNLLAVHAQDHIPLMHRAVLLHMPFHEPPGGQCDRIGHILAIELHRIHLQPRFERTHLYLGSGYADHPSLHTVGNLFLIIIVKISTIDHNHAGHHQDEHDAQIKILFHAMAPSYFV